MIRKKFPLIALVILGAALATAESKSLFDLKTTARISRVRSYAGDVQLDAKGRALFDGKFLLNTGDVSDFLTRILPNGEVDLNFSQKARRLFPVDAVAPGIYTLDVRADGAILVAIGAPNVDGTLASSEIILLRDDGTRDRRLSTRGVFGAGNVVFALRALKDGRILAAGRIQTGPANAAAYLLRLSANGAIDQSYRSERRSMEVAGLAAYALEPTGKDQFLLGKAPFQSETVAEGNDEPRLALLNADGTEVPAFANNARPFVKEGVYTLRVLKDGRILVGGVATLVRLLPDGRKDEFFATPAFKQAIPQRPFSIRAIRRQKDGKLLVGGEFISPLGNSGLVRLLSDGQIDEAFSRNLGRGFESSGDHKGVTAIAIQDDGKILVTGSFETVNGKEQRTIARLNPDGTVDPYPALAEVGLPRSGSDGDKKRF